MKLIAELYHPAGNVGAWLWRDTDGTVKMCRSKDSDPSKRWGFPVQSLEAGRIRTSLGWTLKMLTSCPRRGGEA